MKRGALLCPLVYLYGLLGCGSPGPDECRDVSRGEPCDNLSGYGFFEGALSALKPVARVIPYAPNTPLFSDYATKTRFLYLPTGAQVAYGEPQAFDPPVGSIAPPGHAANPHHQKSIASRTRLQRLKSQSLRPNRMGKAHRRNHR